MVDQSEQRPIVGIGAGGHTRGILEILRHTGRYCLIGLTDADAVLWGHELDGVPVLGDDAVLPGLNAKGVRHAFIGVGSVGDMRVRRLLYIRTLALGFTIETVCHPAAIVSPSAVIGAGATVMAGAIINAAANLGDNILVNTGAIVEHDCRLGHHIHLATGVKLAGGVTVEDGAFIGIGATVLQGIHIGASAIVGAGAVVVADVPDHVVVVGVPARMLRMVEVG